VEEEEGVEEEDEVEEDEVGGQGKKKEVGLGGKSDVMMTRMTMMMKITTMMTVHQGAEEGEGGEVMDEGCACAGVGVADAFEAEVGSAAGEAVVTARVLAMEVKVNKCTHL